MSPEAKSELDTFIQSMNKKFGKGNNAIQKLSDRPLYDSSMVIPTGSIALDTAIGIGGIAKGRSVVLVGNESSGKTSLSLHTVANAQKMGIKCLYIDVEHALDQNYSANLGVNIDELLLSQPMYGEEALQIAIEAARVPEIGLIVIDSVAALVPKAEIDGEMIDNSIGLQARLMSKFMRKITAICSETNTAVVFINQFRKDIRAVYGSGNTPAGGNALKYYASMILEIARTGTNKDSSGNPVSNKTKVTIKKNKLAPPFKTAEFEIKFGIGIDKLQEILDLAVEDKIILKGGAWFKYQGESIGQGSENTKQWLKNNPDVLEDIKQQVLNNRGIGEDYIEENVQTKTEQEDKESTVSPSDLGEI